MGTKVDDTQDQVVKPSQSSQDAVVGTETKRRSTNGRPEGVRRVPVMSSKSDAGEAFSSLRRSRSMRCCHRADGSEA